MILTLEPTTLFYEQMKAQESTTKSMFFSLTNLFVYPILLAYYEWAILSIFILGNGIYVLWILYFMKYCRKIDNHRFYQLSREQSKVIQLITGFKT